VKPHQFTGNETGTYEDPRDNFHYHYHLNLSQEHILWIHRWKQQHLEIHQACKELGLSTHAAEYTKEFMAGVSMEPSTSVSLNIFELEDETDKSVHELMHTNQGNV
jgi:hypothetical protein